MGFTRGRLLRMPTHTETANSNPHAAGATTYPPPGFGYGRGPARVDAITAILRYPLLVIIPVLLLGAVGYVLAGKKQTAYKAESQVLIGSPSPGSAGALPNTVQAEQSLAAIYAREIDFNQVLNPLARELHTTPADIASRLSATPDPQSPLVRIFATAGDPAQAVALANAAATKFASAVNSTTQSNAPVNQAFGAYQRAVAAFERARAKQQHVDQQTSSTGTSSTTGTSSAASSPAAQRAAATTQIAQMRVNALASQYQSLLATQQQVPTLSTFESAAYASSNRKSNLEIYVFGGVVAGLVIGAALASLVANRKTWRMAPAD